MKGKAPIKISHREWNLAVFRCKLGEPVVDVAKEIGTSKQTLYSRIKSYAAVDENVLLEMMATEIGYNMANGLMKGNEVSAAVSAIKMYAERKGESSTERIESKIDHLIKLGEESLSKTEGEV